LIHASFPIVLEYVKYVADWVGFDCQYLNMWQVEIRHSWQELDSLARHSGRARGEASAVSAGLT